MQSVNRFVPDAAFKVLEATAQGSTLTSSANLLVTPIGAIWEAEPAHGKFVVFGKVSDLEDGTDETYAWTVKSDDGSGGSVVTHFTSSAVESAWKEILLDAETMVKENPDATNFYVEVTAAGTAPNFDVEAYVVPSVGP